MILHVRYAYDALVLTGRKQRPERRTYAATASLDLSEASGDDAPLAITYSNSDGKVVEMRAFGDDLYLPLAPGHPSWHIPNKLDVTTLTRMLSDPIDCHPLLGIGIQAAGEAKPIEDDKTVRSAETRTKRYDDERLAKFAADALLIDGIAWTRASEPAYIILHGEVGIDPSPPLSPTHHAILSNVFRLDQRDLLAVEVARLGTGAAIPEAGLHLPGILRYQADEVALASAALRLLTETRNPVSYGGLDKGPFAALRAARKSFDSELAERRADGAEFAPTLQSAADALRAWLTKQDIDVADPLAQTLAECDRAVERWRSNGGLDLDDTLAFSSGI